MRIILSDFISLDAVMQTTEALLFGRPRGRATRVDHRGKPACTSARTGRLADRLFVL